MGCKAVSWLALGSDGFDSKSGNFHTSQISFVSSLTKDRVCRLTSTIVQFLIVRTLICSTRTSREKTGQHFFVSYSRYMAKDKGFSSIATAVRDWNSSRGYVIHLHCAAHIYWPRYDSLLYEPLVYTECCPAPATSTAAPNTTAYSHRSKFQNRRKRPDKRPNGADLYIMPYACQQHYWGVRI